jgi:hypothetical protein
MDLETLLSRAPDLIAVERHGAPAASGAGDPTTHPAVAGALARRVDISARDWACADGALARAAAAIAGAAR